MRGGRAPSTEHRAAARRPGAPPRARRGRTPGCGLALCSSYSFRPEPSAAVACGVVFVGFCFLMLKIACTTRFSGSLHRRLESGREEDVRGRGWRPTQPVVPSPRRALSLGRQSWGPAEGTDLGWRWVEGRMIYDCPKRTWEGLSARSLALSGQGGHLFEHTACQEGENKHSKAECEPESWHF